VFFASERVPALAAQKRALLDRNISSRTVSRKAEQAINDDKEHKVRLRPFFFLLLLGRLLMRVTGVSQLGQLDFEGRRH
jgi:hypothetical protein